VALPCIEGRPDRHAGAGTETNAERDRHTPDEDADDHTEACAERNSDAGVRG